MDADTFRDIANRPAGMEHEANGLVLIFLGEASACRQDGSLRLLSAAAYDRLSTRSGTVHFAGQSQDAGFSLIETRDSSKLIAFGFGVTLAPTTPWWQNLVTLLPEEITREYVGRTFALVELLVRSSWRRLHVAETIHARLLQDRHEERATLTVLPAADTAQAAYAKWGWRKVAQKRNPLPGSPVFDVMVKELSKPGLHHPPV